MNSALRLAAAELHNLTRTLLGLPGPRAIFITSAKPGEGKTFVAVALARLAASYSRERVLLVDANFDRPVLDQRFGCQGAPGLSEALEAGHVSVVLPCPTDLPNLRVLPAGNRAQAGLLFQPALVQPVLAELCARHDLVLIDGGTTQIAAGMAACASATILVADCEDTRREAASGALERLRIPRERLLGAVLNRKRHHIPAAVYERL